MTIRTPLTAATAIAALAKLAGKRSAQTGYQVLEPRVVFDGAAVAAAVAVVAPHVDAAAGTVHAPDATAHAAPAPAADDHALLVDALAHGQRGGAPAAAAPEIVFIDAAVKDPSTIAAAVHDGMEVVMLDAGHDGLDQIAQYLAGRSGIGAIHIISHGQSGDLLIGNTTIDDQALASHQADLAAIGNALAGGGDILLYGCDVAQGSTGHAFIADIAARTGADVAASTDATGSAALGGNWTLEDHVGAIEAGSISAPNSQIELLAILPPIAADDTFTTAQGTTVTINELTNDTSPLGFPLTVSTINTTAITAGGAAVAVSHGTVALTSGGALHYTPTAGYSGPEAFTYTISDGHGGTDVANVTGTIYAPPTLVADTFGTAKNAAISIPVLLNDTDVNAFPLAVTRIGATAITAGGAAVAVTDGTVKLDVSGNLLFTPTANFTGAVPSFTYTVSDGHGGTATTTVIGTVYAPPVAVNDTFATSTDVAITVQALRNDTDANSLPLTVSKVAGAAISAGGPGVVVTGGTVTLDAASNMIFTPDAGYTGAVSYAYSIDDGHGGAATATVNGNVYATIAAADNHQGALLSATGNGIYSIDIPTGKATLLTSAPATVGGVALSGTINSFAVDQANGLIFYCDNNAVSSNKALFAYDFVHDAHILITADLTTFGVTVGAFGVGTAGATFNSGTLYLGVENNAAGGTTDSIYAISLSNHGKTISTVNRLNTNLPTTNDWGDLGYDPVNGNLLSFSAPDLSVTRINSTTGATIGSPLSIPAVSGFQGSQDADGNVYAVGAAFQQINPLTGAAIGAAITVTTNGTTALGGSNDAGGWTPPTATISGEVFSDNMNTRTVVAGDTGIGKVTVQLYSDINNDGVINGSDALLVTAITDADGKYQFSSLLPGDYIVKVSDENGVLIGQTYTTVGAAVNSTSHIGLIGAAVSNIDFGIANSVRAVADTFTTAHDTTAIINVVANDSDPQADVFAVSAVNGTAITAGGAPVAVTGGTVVLDAAGALEYRPNAGYIGNPSFTYTVMDSKGATATATVTGAVTDIAPTVDLNSATAGNSYATTFTEGQSPVAIAPPTDMVGDVDDAMQHSASVVLTNALAGDALAVGDLPAGITASVDTSVAGKITVSFSGDATNADYAAAIAAITYSNTSNSPSTVDRLVNVTVNDGLLGSNAAVATIHVVSVDDAPVEIVPGAVSSGNQPLTISGLSVSDVDVGAGTETVTLSVAHGAITLATKTGLVFTTGDGASDPTMTFKGTLAQINAAVATVTYTPTAGYVGADTLTFTTNDNGNTGSLPAGVTGLTDTRTVGITVYAPPGLVADTFGTPQNTPFTLDVLANDTNVDGFPLTITKIGATAITAGGAAVAVTDGTVGLNIDGTLTFTPTAGYTGAVPAFTYTVSDGHGSIVTASVTGAVYAPPVATNDTFATTTDLPTTFGVLGNDSDVNAFPLAVVAINGVPIAAGDGGVAITGGRITLDTSKNVTFTPDAGYNGSPVFTYTIDDGHGGTATATVHGSVSPLNHPPVNVLPGDQSMTGSTLVFSSVDGNVVQVTDDASATAIIQTTVSVDVGTLTLKQTTGLAFVTGDGTADAIITIKGTKAAINAALDGMIYTAPAGSAATAAHLTITTNDLGQPTGEDIPNGSFDTTLVSVPAGGQTITDQSNVPGWSTTATDHKIEIWGTGFLGVPAYEGIHFAELNANQVAADINTAQIPKGQPLDFSFAHRGRSGVDTMNVTVIDAGTDGVFGTVDDTTLMNRNFSDGNTAWGAYEQPLGTASGNAVRLIFTSVSSAGGNASVGNFLDAVHLGTTHLIDTDALTISLNHPPVALADIASTTEDTPVTVAVLANDRDPDRDPLTVTAVTQGSHGSVAIDPVSGNPIYTPSANFNGTDSFAYTVADGRGGTATATVTVTVTAVDDAPVNTIPAGYNAVAGTPLAITGISIVDVDAGSAPVSVTLGVEKGTLALLTNVAGGLSAAQIVGNGTDTITITAPLSAIDATLAAGNGLVFTPNATATGVVSLAILTNDLGNTGTGGPLFDLDSALITIDALPTPAANTFTTPEDTPFTVPATSGLLANDSDPDGDHLTVTTFTVAGVSGGFSAGGTANIAGVGSLTISGDGSYAFTPAADYNGAVPLATYTVSDGRGGLASSTLSIAVAPVNDPPVVDLDGSTGGFGYTTTFTEKGAPVSIAAAAPAVTDIDSASMATATITLTNPQAGDVLAAGIMPAGITASAYDPATGTITLTGAGTKADYALALKAITFASTNSQPATTDRIIDVTVNDGELVSNTAVATIHVVAVDDAPVNTMAATYTAQSATTTTLTGLSLADPDAAAGNMTLTFAVSAGTLHLDTSVAGGIGAAEVTGNGTGSVTITAPLDEINATLASVHGLDFTAPANAGPVTLVMSSNDNGNTGTGGPKTDFDVRTIHVAQNPTAMNDAGTVAEDGPPLTGAILANDISPNGTLLTVVAAGQAGRPIAIGVPFVTAGGGVLTLAADGAYRFDPGAAYNGLALGQTASETVTYSIADGNGGSATATLVITIVGANDAPVAIDPAHPGTPANPIPAADPLHVIAPVATTDGAAPAPVDVGAILKDPDGEPLAFAATGLPPGLTIDPATGVISGTLPADASLAGPYTVAVTATDPHGATVTTDVIYTVANLPPVAVDDTGSVAEDGPPLTGSVLANDHDTAPDHDPLTVVAAGQAGRPIAIGVPFVTAGGGVLTLAADGAYRFDPGAAYNGLALGQTATETVTYSIADGNGGSATATLVITIVGANDAPVAIDPAHPGTPANPIPAADPLHVIAPVATTDGAAPAPVDVGAILKDPDGEPLAFAATGLPPGLTIDPATGVISGTLPADASLAGPYTVAVTATDPHGATVTTDVIYTVANLPPVAVDDTGSVAEDGPPLTGSVLANDHDTAPDHDPLTVVAAGQAGRPIAIGVPFVTAGGGVLTLAADGAYRFDPGAAYNGLALGQTATETVTYSIADGNGGSATATLVITIVGANDAPVAIDPAHPGTPANPIPAADPLHVIAPVATTDGAAPAPVDVGAILKDPDGEPLAFAATGLPPGLTIDPATGVISGTLPADASLAGPYTVAVTATDPHGATVTTDVIYTVANLPPVAVDDTGSVAEDGPPLTGSVLANDHDTAPDHDPLTVVAAGQAGRPIAIGVPFVTAGGGVLTLAADGAYRFDPGAAYNGLALGQTASETVTYSIADGNGGSATATLVITIVGANDAPVAIDPAHPGTPANPIPAADPLHVIAPVATTDGAAPAPVDVGAILKDPDGEPLAFAATGLPPGLTIDPATGVISGTLPADASLAGPYTVAVTATDPHGATVTTDVIYTVANLPPVAVDDTGSVAEDGPPLTGSVLANDHDTAPDHDPLTVVAAGQAGRPIAIGVPFVTAGGGVLTLAADGAYRFDPGAAYNGLALGQTATETVTYSIADGATATLVITIVGANDAPVAIDPAHPGTPANPIPAADPLHVIAPVATTDGAAPAPVDVGAILKDPDGEPLAFAATGLPPGLTIDPATGVISGTLPADASLAGPYTVAVTATDPHGATVTTDVIYTVANLPPVAVDDTGSVAEDGPPLTGSVLANDHDTAPDHDPLTVVAAGQAGRPIAIGVPFVTAGGGVLTLAADGAYRFDPGAAYNGLALGQTATETVTYSIADGNGGSATATLVITIVGANDAPVAIDPAHPGTPANPIPAADPLHVIAPVATTDGAAPAPVDVGAILKDPDGEPLAFAATGLPPGLTIDPATGVISGTLPADASLAGPYTVAVTATDPHGATVTTDVIYTVANLPPVAVDDTGSVAEDGPPLTGSVLANDHDTAPDHDPLTVVAAGQAGRPIAIGVPFVTAGGGVLTLAADGAYRFDPGAAYNGLALGQTATETVTYSIADGATATLVITIVGANDAPVAIDPAHPGTPANPIPAADPLHVIAPVATTDGAAPAPVDVGAILKDPDGEPLAFAATGLPPGLTIDPATGVISGTPTSSASQGGNVTGQPGVYHVAVTGTDPHGAAVKTIVSFTVVDQPLIAGDDLALTYENKPVTIPVMANDRDPNGDPIRVVAAVADHGTVGVNPDGTLTFIPAPGFVGQARVTYAITDDNGGTATATVFVTVRPQTTTLPTPIHVVSALAADTPFTPISLVGAVLDAANGQYDHSFTADRPANGVGLPSGRAGYLLTQPNPLSLNGEPHFITAKGAVLTESTRLNQFWHIDQILMRQPLAPEGDADSATDPKLGDATLPTNPAKPVFTVETRTNQNALEVSLKAPTDSASAMVIDYQITRTDGRALPDWLERTSFDGLQVIGTAATESLDLRITAILSDGSEVTEDVRLEARSGEVTSLSRERPDRQPALFSQQLATDSMLSEAQSAALAEVLSL